MIAGMDGSITVRPATPDDAASMQAIYAPIVEQTAVSFELTPPTTDDFAERIEATTRDLPWLAAEADHSVVGYAYASHHRARAAYRWSVDTSVYVVDRWRGRGVATALYHSLINDLRKLGYVSAYAGIALPNDGSVRLHEKSGFVAIGRFPTVGFKHGSWHDVGWWHLLLQPPPDSPNEPSPWLP
jgi:phosphinothricin acetyltransferase